MADDPLKILPVEAVEKGGHRRERLRRLAFVIVFIAVGLALAPFTSFPVGFAKVNPTQAFINVLAAVTIGPVGAGFVAFAIGELRVLWGLGTVFAFPGGMIGAILAGITWRLTGSVILTALAEVIGTGLLGTAFSAFLVAPLIHSPATFWALFPGFSLSTLAGSILAVLVVGVLRRAGVPGLERRR